MSKLSIDDAALAFGDVAVAAIGADRTQAGVQAAALSNVQRSYPELFAVLPSEEVWASAVGSWVLLNINIEPRLALADIFTCEAWIETALFRLITAGTLSLAISTPEAERDLIRLGKSVRFHNLFPEAEPTPESEPEPQPAAIDPIDKCISDFKSLPSSAFRKLWMNGTNRQVFDKACAEGRL